MSKGKQLYKSSFHFLEMLISKSFSESAGLSVNHTEWSRAVVIALQFL